MFKESAPPLLTLGGHLFNPTEEFRKETGHAPLIAALVVLDVGVVALVGKDQQVRGIVVGAVTVQVVDDLAGEKGTPQVFGHQLPVQENPFTGFPTPHLGVLLPTLHSPPWILPF